MNPRLGGLGGCVREKQGWLGGRGVWRVRRYIRTRGGREREKDEMMYVLTGPNKQNIAKFEFRPLRLETRLQILEVDRDSFERIIILDLGSCLSLG